MAPSTPMMAPRMRSGKLGCCVVTRSARLDAPSCVRVCASGALLNCDGRSVVRVRGVRCDDAERSVRWRVDDWLARRDDEDEYDLRLAAGVCTFGSSL